MKQKKLTTVHIVSSGISVFLILVFLCVSLVAFSSMNKTTAWFTHNTEVSAKEMEVQVLDDQVHAVLTSYAVSEISGNVYTLDENVLYKLPPHDEEGISYSEYEKALAVVIQIFAHKDMTVNISLSTLNSEILYEEQNHISNAVLVTKTLYDSSARSATLLSGAENAQTFVKINGDTASKVTSLPLDSIELTAEQTVTLCYIFEYNLSFFDYARSQNPLIEQMSLDPDITFIIHSAN